MGCRSRKASSISALLLAAGYGKRLQPFTNDWPKCLMPINGKPLLEYWLIIVRELGLARVLVNTHYLADAVHTFLGRPTFERWVQCVYEPELRGTAGTLRANAQALGNTTVLLVHADNFCQCDFSDFLEFHWKSRPKHCPITLMTFNTKNPRTCGIVEVNGDGVVIGFHEKVEHPPGNLANGAVYLLEPEVLQWICERPEITDFSTQVLPHFIGRIATWHNDGTHIDIGSIESLCEAQAAVSHEAAIKIETEDDWSRQFASHLIHAQIKCGVAPQTPKIPVDL
jgi:mannose-1-phosphate guanylyltransferase